MNFIKLVLKTKYITTLFLCVVVIQVSSAQKVIKLSGGVTSSYSQLNFDNVLINNDICAGYGAAFGISYQLNPKFSLHSGFGVNLYISEIELDTYNSFENTVDVSGDAFEFRYQVNKFSENQEFTAISVPFTIQYETEGDFRLYAKAGFEANFFVNNRYQSSGENITTTGFFSDINAILDRPTFAGFGNFENQEFTGTEVAIKNSYNAILEIGVKKVLKNGNAIYAGLYAKLGLNNIASTASTNGLVSYNQDAPTSFLATSVLQAVDRQRGSETSFGKARLNVFGVNFSYEFSLSIQKNAKII